MILRSLTEYPKHYSIDYDSLDELMKDYITVSAQLEFMEGYNSDLKSDVSISIGEYDYTINITIWKIF